MLQKIIKTIQEIDLNHYITLLEHFQKQQYSMLVDSMLYLILDKLSKPPFNPKIKAYLQHEELPFSNFAADPDNISQIKKILNVLYYLKQILIDVETIKPRHISASYSNAKLLYSETIEKLYQACFLLTHVDIDLYSIFQDEINLLLPNVDWQKLFDGKTSGQILLQKKFNDLVKSYSAEELTKIPVSYTAGYITGIVVDQLQPKTGEYDYEFLTQFSTAIPTYIEKLTKAIANLSTKDLRINAALDKQKIAELQQVSDEIIFNLDHIKNAYFFAPQKYIQYIQVIRHIITLSMSSLEQFNQLNDSSKVVIHDNLHKIKSDLLPTLLQTADKIEINAMLVPGTLSKPLIEKIKPLYDLLSKYAASNQSEPQNQDSLQLDDPRFLQKRLEPMYKRILTSNKNLRKFDNIAEAYKEFYNILEKPEYERLAVYQLPTDDKDQLRTHYDVIKSYLAHVDFELNGVLNNTLYPASESWSSYLQRMFGDELPPDLISFVLEPQTKMKLNHLISKKQNTEKFQIQLNQEFINMLGGVVPPEDQFTEDDDSTVEYPSPTPGREHHVIPHTKYSSFFASFKKYIYSMRELLNHSMQQQLNPKSSSMPFPELDNPDYSLTEGQQLIFFKQIFNGLYHLENIFHELEGLRNDSTETGYLLQFFKAIGQLVNVITVAKKIMADPYFSLIGRLILEKAQILLTDLQKHADLSQIKEEFKGPMQNIETIKQNTGIFQLFMQTPTMYNLYSELITKINTLTKNSHDAVVDNLDYIKTKLLSQMLLEADLFEDKLGLQPGIFTDPLKQMTDEMFRGLLDPLGLPAKDHIRLISNTSPIENRIKRADEQIVNVKEKLKTLETDYKEIHELHRFIEEYQELHSGRLPANDLVRYIQEQQLIALYAKCQHKLAKEQKKVKVKSSTNEDVIRINHVLRNSRDKDAPDISDIVQVVSASHHRYFGKKATYQLQLNSQGEQLGHLNKLKEKQELANVKYIDDYTIKAFNQHLKSIVNQHVGLQYSDKEYQRDLQAFLMPLKDEIINTAKKADDLSQTIKESLDHNRSQFEQNHLVEYGQFDNVRVALAEFKTYFSHCNNNPGIFEDNTTLSIKTQMINELAQIADNSSLTMKDRFAMIKQKVEERPIHGMSHFERCMLKSKEANFFSFTYILQCIVALLKALFIYTPAKDALLQNLQESINEKPILTPKVGLFAEPKRNYEAPTLPLPVLG